MGVAARAVKRFGFSHARRFHHAQLAPRIRIAARSSVTCSSQRCLMAFPFASGFARARMRSMKSSASGLSDRFLRLMILCFRFNLWASVTLIAYESSLKAIRE
jgi:hypothetical protein